jgi:hypothetical protein
MFIMFCFSVFFQAYNSGSPNFLKSKVWFGDSESKAGIDNW